MKNVVVAHYSEIGTKGGNRRQFEAKLAEDIRRRLGGEALRVRIENARIVADLSPQAQREKVASALDRVFGLAWYAFGVQFPWSTDDDAFAAVEKSVVEKARSFPSGSSFKIQVRRSAKGYPHASQAMCEKLGAAVVDQTGLPVNVHSPDNVIVVEVLDRTLAILSGRVEGLRGMPRASSGRMVCLFSGGIDSPVAAWMMMRRGARVDFLHFHPFRSCQEVVGTKITRLFDALAPFSPQARLFLVPHDRYQATASLKVPTSCETVFFRRFMLRAGEEVARRRGHQALVTGDSLGQVASQTLDNLAAVQTRLSVPLFQPLIASDKETIIKLAKSIGVYDLAIQPYKDCCSLLSKKPKTSVKGDLILRLEDELDMQRIVEESLASASAWDGTTLSPLGTTRTNGDIRKPV